VLRNEEAGSKWTLLCGNCVIYLVRILHPITLLEADIAQFMNGFQTIRLGVIEISKALRLPESQVRSIAFGFRNKGEVVTKDSCCP
jgi:hypothetical protein